MLITTISKNKIWVSHSKKAIPMQRNDYYNKIIYYEWVKLEILRKTLFGYYKTFVSLLIYISVTQRRHLSRSIKFHERSPKISIWIFFCSKWKIRCSKINMKLQLAIAVLSLWVCVSLNKKNTGSNSFSEILQHLIQRTKYNSYELTSRKLITSAFNNFIFTSLYFHKWNILVSDATVNK